MADRGRIFTVTRDGSLAPAVFSYPTLNEELKNMVGGRKDGQYMKVVLTEQASRSMERSMQMGQSRSRQNPTATSMCINDYVEHQMLKKETKAISTKPSFDVRSWKR
jgi:hypothetical protein